MKSRLRLAPQIQRVGIWSVTASRLYLDHRTVDHKFNIITDVHVTQDNVQEQALMTATVQNIKKIALHLAKKAK